MNKPTLPEQSPDTDEQQLLDNLRAGGKKREVAISTLYRDYAARIRSYYINHRASATEAEDWVHDCFVKIVKSIDNFRGDSPLSAWIWTIARNVMLDAIRKRKTDTSTEDFPLDSIMDGSASAIEHIESEELKDCVQKRFAEFLLQEPDRAQCIVWAIIDGLRIKEISTILDRTPGATREYLFQCRKRLRSYLEPCLEHV